jgi:polyisoprenoid-binding protein YceI
MRMRNRFGGFVISLFVVGIAIAARASEWTIDPEQSTINIAGTATGQAFTGRFKLFKGAIQFEPGPSPSGNVHVEIAVRSLETGAADRDDLAQSSDWFSGSAYPNAVFDAISFKSAGGNNYLADGTLKIKDISARVSLPFSLDVDARGEADMRSQIAIDRSVFKLGEGQFADEAAAGHSVAILISIHAKRQ